MRVFYFLILLAFAAAVCGFAYLNQETVRVKYPGGEWDTTLPVLVLAVYGLGMLTGWTVVGIIRRSWRKAVVEGQR